MHPAPSIVLFTVLSGLGLGMMTWLGLGLGPDDALYRWLSCGLALAFAGLGGLASTGHLGRRENAWRAFSQWRSSWLSREACLMVAAMAVFGLYAAIWCLGGQRITTLGLAAAALALATVYSTAMIYAQLKTVPRWSATPTPVMFLVIGLTGGLLGAGAMAGLTVGPEGAGWAAPVIAAAAGVAVWWQTAAAGAGRGSQGSSLETATGLGFMGRVRLFEAPHTGSNYLLKEMAYQIGRKRAFELRRAGAVLGFLLPLVLALLAPFIGGWLMLLALASHLAGMLALRWLFFAEAEHVQALYYGSR
ncbi:MAG TPA: DmsC/YnfH family molybdoenzyme membrane anchor subunit [Thermohalobaculum sp.]|nr:DmsC/YnfH family molybdoenzyme membrane anchor subunit [Thermohalobaculum sp.]